MFCEKYPSILILSVQRNGACEASEMDTIVSHTLGEMQKYLNHPGIR